IIEEQKNISIQNAQLTKLKRHVEAQSRLAAKKQKLLEEGIVKKYNTPEKPS
ncbi:1955_t:CDS:1, partial [Funneliformis mosseae]